MPNCRKILRILCVLPLLFFVSLSLFIKDVHAATNYAFPDAKSIEEDLQKASDNTTIVDTAINSRFFGTLTGIVANNIYCFTKQCNDQRKNAGQVPNSAIDFLAKAGGSIYTNPPASFSWYAQDFLANAGLGPEPAYAQGIGFTALNALLPLWRASRNIAYSILVIIMVAIGFMIIFRMKIDPKTVISVQAAIPKIIVTLLLITFSYAIVGFLIDVMYIAMAVLISIIASNAPGVDLHSNVPALQQQYMTGGLGTLFGSVWSGGLRSLPILIESVAVPGGVAAGAVGFAASRALQFGNLLTGLLSLAMPLILILATVLGLLFTSIRLMLLLLNSYIQLLVALILGPILILQEAIPGRSAFSGWLLNVIANLSVFPTTVAILLFGWTLTTGLGYYNPLDTCGAANIHVGSAGTSPNIWVPPLLGFATMCQSIFPSFLGLGVFFLAPSLVVAVKKVFQPKPSLPISAGTMFSPLTGAISTGMGAASQFYYMKQIIAPPGPEGQTRGPFADVMGGIRRAVGGK